MEISAHTRLGIEALDSIGVEDANLLTRLHKYSDYIQIRNPVYIPHTAGRYAAKRFRKAQCPIIERLTNSLMMNGRNNGKKLMAVRIVAHSFEIVRAIFREYLELSQTMSARDKLLILCLYFHRSTS
jgi:hypothetical protein